MNQDRLEQLAQQAYDEARALRDQHDMGEVVGRMTILYGPPLLRPDLALISFQGGAEDPSPSLRTWPPRLLYLDDPYRFGRKLRRHFSEAGLSRVLESSAAGRGRVFARARVCGAPAVYCHHLSQGCKDDEVARCLDEIRLLVGGYAPKAS